MRNNDIPAEEASFDISARKVEEDGVTGYVLS